MIVNMNMIWKLISRNYFDELKLVYIVPIHRGQRQTMILINSTVERRTIGNNAAQRTKTACRKQTSARGERERREIKKYIYCIVCKGNSNQRSLTLDNLRAKVKGERSQVNCISFAGRDGILHGGLFAFTGIINMATFNKRWTRRRRERRRIETVAARSIGSIITVLLSRNYLREEWNFPWPAFQVPAKRSSLLDGGKISNRSTNSNKVGALISARHNRGPNLRARASEFVQLSSAVACRQLKFILPTRDEQSCSQLTKNLISRRIVRSSSNSKNKYRLPRSV